MFIKIVEKINLNIFVLRTSCGFLIVPASQQEVEFGKIFYEIFINEV